jgi:hypothetical protein
MSTRNGKIARLPKKIREELNQRMDDGQQGEKLLSWLNEVPEVKALMAERFSGSSVTKQNLSEWRLGGFEDWRRHEMRLSLLQRLGEEGHDLRAAENGREGHENLLRVMLAELAARVYALGDIQDEEEQWQRLRQLSRELARLQAEVHRSRKLDFQQEKWELEQESNPWVRLRRHEAKQAEEQQKRAEAQEQPEEVQVRPSATPRKYRAVMVVKKRCGCVCDECNAGKEVTAEDIEWAGRPNQPPGLFAQCGECRCFCPGCESTVQSPQSTVHPSSSDFDATSSSMSKRVEGRGSRAEPPSPDFGATSSPMSEVQGQNGSRVEGRGSNQSANTTKATKATDTTNMTNTANPIDATRAMYEAYWRKDYIRRMETIRRFNESRRE